MIPSHSMAIVIWIFAFVVQGIRIRIGRPTIGLCLSYTASLGSVHFVAEMCYTYGSYWDIDRGDGILGFRLSSMGILGLTVGVLLQDFVTSGRRRRLEQEKNNKSIDLNEQIGAGTRIVIVGCLLYVTGILGGLGVIPGLAAVFGGTLGVIVTGILLNWRAYRLAGRPDLALAWLLGLPSLPLAGVVLQGFIGFGMNAVLIAGCFILARTRIRWWSFPLGAFAVYAGLSLWVSYAAIRTDLRERVWYRQTSLNDRINFLTERLYMQMAWLDINDQDQMVLLSRLDQNSLVGKSAVYIESGGANFGHGETLYNALLALIPRIIWSDKPSFGGSGGIVTKYTGVPFAEGTSVGVGQIMELYINYGEEFIFIGLLLLGFFVAALDTSGGQALSRGDVWGFVSAFIVAQPFLLSQGNYAEVSAAVLGGWILAQILRFIGGNWVADIRSESS